MRLDNFSTVLTSDSIQPEEKQLYQRFMGFLPAFRHSLSGETHLSCEKDGSLAPVHRLDNLPERWLNSNAGKSECKLKQHIEKGYIIMGHFLNQDEAAHLLPH